MSRPGRVRRRGRRPSALPGDGRTAGRWVVWNRGDSFAPQVPVHDGDRVTALAQFGGEGLTECHRPVFPTGAAHRDGHIRLLLAKVTLQDRFDRIQITGDELRGTGQAEDVVAYWLILPGQVAQFADPVRVGQEPDIDNVVGEIGRASCRERGAVAAAGETL